MSFVYDGKMNYERAKKELGLGDSFTDAELKAAYHSLVTKYHPDINGNTDEEKRDFTEHMKAINDAYKILNGKNKNTSKTYDDYVSLEKYKHEQLLHFCKKIHFPEKYGSEFKKFEEEISLLVITEIGPSVGSAKNKKSVDSIIKAAYKKFDDLLTSQVDDFCSQHGITKQDLNRCFNLELELKKRNPKQLCTKLKEALQKIKKLKIEEVVQKYVGYAGYIDIKDKIDFFKQKAISSNKNIVEIVKELQENIDKTFENYFNNIKLIDELIELTKSVDDKEMLEELKEVIQKINDDDFKKRYDDLKRKMYNYNMSKELDSIFKSINEKGANALKSCKSLDETTIIYTIFSKSLELINKIKMKKMPVTDELKGMLNKITFKDFANDINILDLSISSNDEDYSIDNIYLTKYSSIFQDHFFVERDGVVFKIDEDRVSIQENFIKEDYISLSEFLDKSKIEDKFCYERHDIMTHGRSLIYVMYTYQDDRCICLIEKNNELKMKIYHSNELLNVNMDKFMMEQYQYKYKKYIDRKDIVKNISEMLNKVIDVCLIKNSEPRKPRGKII